MNLIMKWDEWKDSIRKSLESKGASCLMITEPKTGKIEEVIMPCNSKKKGGKRGGKKK